MDSSGAQRIPARPTDGAGRSEATPGIWRVGSNERLGDRARESGKRAWEAAVNDRAHACDEASLVAAGRQVLVLVGSVVKLDLEHTTAFGDPVKIPIPRREKVRNFARRQVDPD